jgi:hypothetical protein
MERNIRTFNQEFTPVDEVAFLIKEDIQQYQLATLTQAARSSGPSP